MKNYFDFADNDHKLISYTPRNSDLFDSIVVLYQQCCEKNMKGIIKVLYGEDLRTRKLTTLLRDISTKYPELNEYKNLCRELQDSYFDRRYPNEDYYPLSQEEFMNIEEESEKLIKKLIDIRKELLEQYSK